MKVFLKILILSCTISSSFASWKFHNQYDKTFIYKAPLGSRLVVEGKMTATKKKKFTKKFLIEIEKKKEKMLAIIGVTNWQVSKRNIIRHKDYVELNFSGSYRNRKGENIFFVENHYYKPRSKIQFLITNSNKEKLEKDLKENSFEKIKKAHEL